MRLQFDELCKQLLTAAFAPADRVARNAELEAPDAQKVDLLIESVRKLLTARRKTPPMRSWLLSAGRPDTAMAELGFLPDASGASGVYRLLPGWATGLVVLSELPEGPDTLLFRLLGRGPTFRAALRELAALPLGSWLREVALPILMRLRLEARQSRVEGDTMSDEAEALMATGEQLYQEWEQRTREQGRIEALREAEQRYQELEQRIREQGRAERLGLLSHQFERRLGRALTDIEAAELGRRLNALGPERLGDVVLDLTSAELTSWLADSSAR
jgi:hypothetical protein